ncbi:MAG: ABC transporter substrate-binding protein [Alphaproteobacteria bacterium]
MTVAVAGAATSEPKQGGVLNIALFPEPPMIVSAFNSSTFVGLVSTKIFDGLVTYDFDMTPRPHLAKSWNISDDGLSYEFKLREDVTWHDGKPFTSADVKFSLEKVWSQMHPRGRTTYQHVAAVDTPDAHTVVVRLNKPTPILMKALSSYESQVIPKHIFDDGQEIARHPGLNKPIGTGPFVFKEWKKGEYIILERNPNYWDKPKPYLDRMVWRIIPDAAARAAALETGEVHYAPFSRVPVSDIPRLDELPHIDVETRGYEYLSPIFLLEVNNRNEYLKHVKVRQAMVVGQFEI